MDEPNRLKDEILFTTVDLSGVAGLLLNKESYLRVEKDRNGTLKFRRLGVGQVGQGWAGSWAGRAWLGLAWLGPGQVEQDGAGLNLARLGVWQARAGLGWVLGRWGRQGQPGLGSAWLDGAGLVLARLEVGQAGLGPRQVGQSGAVSTMLVDEY
ncbi:hypothetical protein BY996DRAFT_6612654 [Phakopsora pachyrhizi]|nr:hypothetical protein BY996DRAFT_6612654 [Phakopsora pachyrhizi]